MSDSWSRKIGIVTSGGTTIIYKISSGPSGPLVNSLKPATTAGFVFLGLSMGSVVDRPNLTFTISAGYPIVFSS